MASSYVTSSLVNNDKIACRVTTTLSCRINNQATSSSFNVVVYNYCGTARIAYTQTEKELQVDDSSFVYVNEEVQIYPNPSAKDFAILIGGEDKEYDLEILNLEGKLLISRKISSGAIANVGADLISGMYILKIIDRDKIRTYKLMKQR